MDSNKYPPEMKINICKLTRIVLLTHTIVDKYLWAHFLFINNLKENDHNNFCSRFFP